MNIVAACFLVAVTLANVVLGATHADAWQIVYGVVGMTIGLVAISDWIANHD